MSRWTALAVLVSVVSAIAATWAAASSPTDTILCNFIHPDCLGNHWLMVWVAETVSEGGSLLHNDRYYWPVGDSPWLAGNGSEGFAYLPWHLLFGWPLASNVHLIGLLVLNGLAAYALARATGASGPASLAAAPTGSLLVYALQELGAGRFTQVSLCWLGFFLASWVWFLDAPNVRRALLSAALLAFTCLFYWYYGFFGVIAGAVLLAFRPAAIRPLVVFSAAFILLIAPLLVVFLSNWMHIVGTGEDAFPHPESIRDSAWPGVPFLVIGGRHSGRALPFLTCVLAAVGLWNRDRRTWGLGAVALVFAALTAGPLIPNGPYEWIYGLSAPLRRFWWPYRHVVVVNLALIALAARGADRVLDRLPQRFRPLTAVALAVLVPIQLTIQGAAWRTQFTRAEVPVAFYQSLRDAPGDILLEPPLAPEIASSLTGLLYQFDHRKKLLVGHHLWVERVRPPAWEEFVAANSFLVAIQRLERAESGGVFRFEAEDLQALIDGGMRTLVVNREYFPVVMQDLVAAHNDIATALFGRPTHTGKRVKAWDMGRWSGRSEVAFTPWAWPKGLQPGGPTLSIQGIRAPSLGFSIPSMEPPTSGGSSGSSSR